MEKIALPVTLTDGAVKEIKRILSQPEVTATQGLRIGVKGGGCSGMSYIMGVEEKQEGDYEFEHEGVKIFMNKSHSMYLMGMKIDFGQGLNARGFEFINPNASSTCGCGESFSV